jgi:hypothetical protein
MYTNFLLTYELIDHDDHARHCHVDDLRQLRRHNDVDDRSVLGH